MPLNMISLPELRDRRFVFRDRAHAGEVLSDMLKDRHGENAMVLSIPAGGVPVGKMIAGRLGLPMDVAVVSKITLPWSTEAGYGAVAFDGAVRLNEYLMARTSLTDVQVREGIEDTRGKVDRRLKKLRGRKPFPDLSQKEAILVDDGLASGFTMFTAIDALRHAGAARIVVAIPTAHADAAASVAAKADMLYCANIRGGYRFAVAEAYEQWHDIDEAELISLLT